MKIMIFTLFAGFLLAQDASAIEKLTSAGRMGMILKHISKSQDFYLTDVTGIQRSNIGYEVSYIQYVDIGPAQAPLKFNCTLKADVVTLCAPCAQLPPPAKPPKCPCSTSVVLNKSAEVCSPF
jgi:hypothetical protein